jgi:hypothetical protein
VPPLDALLTIKSRCSYERSMIECAVNKIFAGGPKTLADYGRRNLQVLFHGFAKAGGLAFQSFAPQPPKFGSIGFGQAADGVYAVTPLVASI